jgi:hypothetical protein
MDVYLLSYLFCLKNKLVPVVCVSIIELRHLLICVKMIAFIHVGSRLKLGMLEKTEIYYCTGCGKCAYKNLVDKNEIFPNRDF